MSPKPRSYHIIDTVFVDGEPLICYHFPVRGIWTCSSDKFKVVFLPWSLTVTRQCDSVCRLDVEAVKSLAVKRHVLRTYSTYQLKSEKRTDLGSAKGSMEMCERRQKTAQAGERCA